MSTPTSSQPPNNPAIAIASSSLSYMVICIPLIREVFDLPLFLLYTGTHSIIFLGIWCSPILCTCPYQHSCFCSTSATNVNYMFIISLILSLDTYIWMPISAENPSPEHSFYSLGVYSATMFHIHTV